MNNNPYTLALARFPNLANVKVIVDFTIRHLKLPESRIIALEWNCLNESMLNTRGQVSFACAQHNRRSTMSDIICSQILVSIATTDP